MMDDNIKDVPSKKVACDGCSKMFHYGKLRRASKFTLLCYSCYFKER